MDVSKNSSPIDRAPGARSKSGEFVETSILYSKLSSISCLKPLKTCCTFWDPDSGATAGGVKTTLFENQDPSYSLMFAFFLLKIELPHAQHMWPCGNSISN